ncbi:MAG: Gfo/Idh/MocA family oxidoreductase [Deltaproteobacteria bacterium]|nr:MAG: Gfo/Idh/MocA family oxidoreductase [Deltaproteobacteria bacterium]
MDRHKMMQPKDLRLGIIGLSEGNGHPYSWSAIFNGYNREVMAKCPYPVIPEYLSSQFFPHDAIQGAKVTHVWAQERAIAENIAAASLIPHIVSYYEDMIGQIDAILLARDDAENHLKMSIPFLDAGLPIYIDKPIALTLDDIESLYSYQQYNGQIFSCSAMRFSEELQLSALDRENLGDIGHIQAVIPKSWKNMEFILSTQF